MSMIRLFSYVARVKGSFTLWYHYGYIIGVKTFCASRLTTLTVGEMKKYLNRYVIS